MKIAVVTHPVNSGGVSRFQKLLIQALLKNYPDLTIDIYVSSEILKRDNLKDLSKNKKIALCFFSDYGIKETPLEDLAIKKNTQPKTPLFLIKKYFKKIPFFIAIYRGIKKIKDFNKEEPWYKFKLNQKLEKKLNEYDIVYLPFPFFIEPFKLQVPIIATFHDFNWKHNFIGNFNKEMEKLLEVQSKKWFQTLNTAISSTKFIQNEMVTFYPELKCKKKVVYLSYLGKNENNAEKELDIYDKFKLPKEYILYPGRIARHKNVLNLLKAVEVLKNKSEKKVPLVLTGDNTDNVSCDFEEISETSPLYEVNKYLSSSHLILNKDIYPLGYVSDQEIDALIKGAELVISPSLYEAGSGPGLDAWKAGTPVAFSNISPFLEQMEFLKTKAWVFDPEKPEDIALKIAQALREKDRSLKMAEESKEAIDKYTWDDVAKGYYEVFQNAHNERRGK